METQIDSLIVNHPCYNEALRELHLSIESSGKTVKPRCIVIVGPSGSGKSTVIAEFAKKFPVTESESGLTRPVLVVETPSNPNVKAMASAVLAALDDPLYFRGTEVQMTFRIKQLLEKQGVRLLVIDEMQNLIDRDSMNLNYKTADWLKGVINRTQIPIAIVGLEQAEQLFLANEQLRRRFREPYKMEPFDWDDDKKRASLRSFLKTIQGRVQFEEGLKIYANDMAHRFYCATNGLVGYIVDIIREAKDLASGCVDPAIRRCHLAQAYANVVCGNHLIGVNPFSDHEQLERALAVVQSSLTKRVSTMKKKGTRKPGGTNE